MGVVQRYKGKVAFAPSGLTPLPWPLLRVSVSLSAAQISGCAEAPIEVMPAISSGSFMYVAAFVIYHYQRGGTGFSGGSKTGLWSNGGISAIDTGDADVFNAETSAVAIAGNKFQGFYAASTLSPWFYTCAGDGSAPSGGNGSGAIDVYYWQAPLS